MVESAELDIIFAMKLRNTLLLLVLAFGLFAFIWFFERKQPGTALAAEQSKRVLIFDRDGIDGITIFNDQETVELRRDAQDRWHLTQPVQDRADTTMVASIFTSAEQLTKEQTLEPEKDGEKKQLKEFGVNNAKLRLKLSGKNAPPELLLGKDAAVEGRMYARVDGSDTAFVVRNDLRNQLLKPVDDFRDRRLTDLTPDQVQRVLLKSSAGEIELQREHGDWSIKKPMTARGSSAGINDLVAGITNAKIAHFLPGDGAEGADAGDSRGSITLFAEGREEPVVLELTGAPDSAQVVGRLSSRNGAYLLPATVAKPLELRPNDLRDRRLMDINFDIVDRITIEPAGQPKIVLIRKNDQWTINGGEVANAAEVQRMVTTLSGREVTAFVSDVATDLEKFGLATPQMKVTLSSYASENTAESTAGENPIVTVLFGAEQDGQVFARLEEEPFIVSVERAVLDAVHADPALWRDLTVFDYGTESVKAVEIIAAGQPPVSLQRSEGGKWKPADPKLPLNEVNVESLINTLTALRAVRRVPPVQEPETLRVTFTLDGPEPETETLIIGSETLEGMWNARVEGNEGEFLLSRPDVEALRLPLQAASEATPSPSPAP